MYGPANPHLPEEGMASMSRPNKTEAFPEIIGTFMGRDALRLAVSLLDLHPDDRVLLPAYLCQEVSKPFHGKNRIEFYDVGPELAADPEEINRRLTDARLKVMMIINYFGFLQPHRGEIKGLCGDRGVTLIEDCAHSLLTGGSGDTGDLCVYSFRKLLPVPDGGGLKVTTPGNAISPRFYPRLYSNLLSLLIIAKSRFKIRSEVFSRAGITSRTRRTASKPFTLRHHQRFLPLSWFAQNGMKKAPISEIIARRRGDYLLWQEWSTRSGFCAPVFHDLPEGVCPLGFPVRTRNRDEIKSHLQERGIFLKTHWNLPSTVAAECMNSHALSKETLTLPVYPELAQGEREAIIESFEKSGIRWCRR
jgi:perosamine synthetase